MSTAHVCNGVYAVERPLPEGVGPGDWPGCLDVDALLYDDLAALHEAAMAAGEADPFTAPHAWYAARAKERAASNRRSAANLREHYQRAEQEARAKATHDRSLTKARRALLSLLAARAASGPCDCGNVVDCMAEAAE